MEREMNVVIEDPPDMVEVQMKLFAKLRSLCHAPTEEEEILQTKIISQMEVRKDWEKWKPSVAAVVNSMLHEKEALKELTKEELEDLIRQANSKGKKVEFLPSKMVFTKKPIPGSFKYKSRLVICGNYEEKKPSEVNYSGGADATSFRTMIHYAALNQWEGMTLDIKCAFLNALIDQLEEESDMVVVKPPTILVEKGMMTPSTCYLPIRAVYGLRRSPRLWGICRDKGLTSLRALVKCDEFQGTIKLETFESEPHLWKLVPDFEGEEETSITLGLLMTYVDDIFMVGPISVIQEVSQKIMEMWETTPAEKVGIDPVRFLGMEVSKEKDPEKTKEVWKITQESYVKDLLAEGKVKPRKVPISREQSQEEGPPDVQPTQIQVRDAQKACGELLWLVTRTRPDLMFAVSRMGALTLKDPVRALKINDQVRGYLSTTVGEGLLYTSPDEGEKVVLAVYTDASYGPDSSESHGSIGRKVPALLEIWQTGHGDFEHRRI